ncbi:MAG: hypothetical protein IPQ08_09600 [Chitinophagaceae bacterium]|nr:hypothetical protein [Chitinophagaceae bacterium]
MDSKDSLTKESEQLFENLKAAGVEIELSVDPTAPTWYVQTKYRFKIGSSVVHSL